MSNNSLLLVGLDGSNPLAFLAALGTLRTLALALPDEAVRMGWEQQQGFWSPRIHCSVADDQDKLVELLDSRLKLARSRMAFAIGDNLNLPLVEFHKTLLSATSDVESMGTHVSRIDVDFLAAFGSDALADENGQMQDTALRTMGGAGHQHFLKSFRELVLQTHSAHLKRSLMYTWDYLDDGRGLTLRWDPSEDRRYALRWDDPSCDPIKTMRGANRLAIESLPLLVTMPTRSRVATAGFEGSGRRNTYFIWPIWTPAISVDTVRSLLTYASRLRLASGDNAAAGAEKSEIRMSLGITAMFASARITNGKFRNFTPAATT